MRIQFLFPYPLNESPSQRFRFEQYFKILSKENIEISCQSFWDEHAWNILYQNGFFFRKLTSFLRGYLRRFFILFKLRSANYVFIHRECTPLGPPIIEWIIAKVLRKKIIYDFDDAIWLSNTSAENSIVTFLKFHNKTAAICKWAYKVSCGNDFLAEYAQRYNQHVFIIPTTIDTNVHLPKRQNDNSNIVIGWTGSHSTLKYLTTIESVLQPILEKFNHVTLTIIADKIPTLNIPFSFVKWNKESEIEDLQAFDIGIMPLPDDVWSKGKCGFKALQYLAIGIPAVASPVGVNSTIINNGVNGFLASTDKEWIDALNLLITDASLRKSLGKNGIKTIEERYSVNSVRTKFLDLFDLH
jgi:glycosyltransferase involved in cell wall biosynthesis